MAKFRTKARAIDLLGKNQIADLPTAITELWKNGYDAYADILNADLYEKGYKSSKHHVFTIADDGHGMSKDDLENKWIVIGTESKKNENNVTPPKDRFGKEIRVPLGEKGIGRLSVTYIGDHMLLITKKQNSPYEILFMNWKILNNFDLYLEDINIPITTLKDLDFLDFEYMNLLKEYKKNLKHESWDNFKDVKNDIQNDLSSYDKIPDFLLKNIKNHYKNYNHGTYFIIFDPIEEVQNIGIEQTDDMLKEERENMLKNNNYIRSVLSALFNPFDIDLNLKRKKVLGDKVNDSPKFTIYKSDNRVIDYLKLNEFFTIDDFENCENWIKGNFNEYGEFEGKIKVLGNIKDYYLKPQRTHKKTKFGVIEMKLAFWEGTAKNSTMPKELYNIYEKKAATYSGLYVYRDGFRVLPYGRTDFDFLEFEKRRSLRAGKYYFSHRKMIGYIGITKNGNPKLIDKSGREGFVSNPAYKEMKELLENFFVRIAQDEYGTESESRKDYLSELNLRKEQDRIIAEEQTKNREELKFFRNLLKSNEKKLNNTEKEIYDLTNLLENKFKNKKILQKEQIEIINNINRLESELLYLKIVPSQRLNLTDSDKDKFFDYENNRISLKNKLDSINSFIIERTYINELKDTYVQKFKEMYGKINDSYYASDEKYYEKINSLTSLYNNYKNTEFDKLKAFSPDVIDIDNISFEDTTTYLKELSKTFEVVYTNYKETLLPFIDYLENIDLLNTDQKLIGIYKAEEKKLSKKVEELHELAQLGMAIEIIDHQFNVLYDQISSSLVNITPIFRKNKDEYYDEQFNLLKSYFQHLESNHKLLVPLYRTTRRSKKIITGEEIKNVILSFFGNVLLKDNINFYCDSSFLNYEFYSFESIINPVFINIFNNAVYWVRMKECRQIRIECNKKNEILIMNSGEKMTYTDLTNCFELFFSKKPSGRGIGLYLAKTNLRSVNLDIYATNDENYNKLGGACFVICTYGGEI